MVQPPIFTNVRLDGEYCQQTALVFSTNPQITVVFQRGVTRPEIVSDFAIVPLI